MSSSPRSNVLSERSPNIPQSPEKSKNGLKADGKLQDAQPKSLEYHRQELEARLKENKSVNTTSTLFAITTTKIKKKKTVAQPKPTPNSSDITSFGSSATVSPATTIISHDSDFTHRAHKLRSPSRNQQAYVSPSDNIQSPATAKLAAFKNRHIKSVKPRTLFAKTAANNAEAVAAKQSTIEQQKRQLS